MKWIQMKLREISRGNTRRRRYRGGNQKKENNDREANMQNFEDLTNDFNNLKEEKKKMETFYQKKLKEMELEKRKKKVISVFLRKIRVKLL